LNDTNLRDTVSKLAQVDIEKAIKVSKKIIQPWFRAQALAHIARYIESTKVIKVANEAKKTANECDDDYKKSSVRAWEIVALSERGLKKEAEKSLNEAVKLAVCIAPLSSRCEALFNLFQASCHIDMSISKKLYARMQSLCPIEEHWRAKRAIKNANKIIIGKSVAREYF